MLCSLVNAGRLWAVVVSLAFMSSCVPLTTDAFTSAEEFSRSVRIDVVGGKVTASSLAMGTLCSDRIGRLRFRFSEAQEVGEAYVVGLELLSSRRHEQVVIVTGVSSDCRLAVVDRDRVRSGAWVTRLELSCSEAVFAKLGGATIVLKAPGARWTVRIPARLIEGFMHAVSMTPIEGVLSEKSAAPTIRKLRGVSE